MSSGDAPILDFDPATTAIIEPEAIYPPVDDWPTRCVISWMGDALAHFIETHQPRERRHFYLESIDAPIYEHVADNGERVIVVLAMVGAPASVSLLEALISHGCTTFVAIGSSGGLLPDFPPGTVVVPDAAIRDEGVSYHYAEASLLAHADADFQTHLRQAYTEAGNLVAEGTAWTTDAFFRETKAKVATRISQGAIAVDMEMASLVTVAAFRSVRLGQALYMADTLHSDQWDPTELVDRDTNFRYQLLLTAIRACSQI